MKILSRDEAIDQSSSGDTLKWNTYFEVNGHFYHSECNFTLKSRYGDKPPDGTPLYMYHHVYRFYPDYGWRSVYRANKMVVPASLDRDKFEKEFLELAIMISDGA
jgi:hypothetical protein